MKKTIQILLSDGLPAVDTYIIPEHGDEMLTDFDGFATVQALSEDENILITTVGGVDVNFKFKDLPDVITLDANSLAPVYIENKPKKKTWAWWLLGGVASLFLLNSDNPKKIKL